MNADHPKNELPMQTASRLTEALALSEKKLRRRIERLSEIIFETSAEGKLSFLNRAWTDTLGYEVEKSLGTALRDYAVEEDKRMLEQALDAPVAGSHTQARLLRHDGGIAWMELSAMALEEGGVVGALHDFTQLRQIQQELKAAKEEAESANSAKTRFLATISHEMRTPLNVILGNTELAKEAESEEEFRHYLRRIDENAEILLRLITDLLDISKIEAGQLEWERRPFDLRHSLRQSVAPFEAEAARKGLDFQVQVDDQLPKRVWGDAARLRQIVAKLVENAVKFTEQGSVRVEARSAPLEKGAGLVLRVADSSPGIPEADLPHIFDRFFLVDSSTARSKKNAGLGLSIVKSLVEFLGGTVEVRNIVGEGVDFLISIPLEVAAESKEGSRKTSASSTCAAAPCRQDRSILVAEDNDDNYAIVERYLTAAGYHVERAANGRMAVEAAARARFDLILMDVEMPEMDGVEATRLIRAAESAKGEENVPILALTAHAVMGYFKRCMQAGCTGYLTKPLRKQTLLDCVAAALAGS